MHPVNVVNALNAPNKLVERIPYTQETSCERTH